MEIIRRKEAKIKGFKRYFTSKPCPKGHVAERYTSVGRCVACGAETHKRTYIPVEKKTKTEDELIAQENARRNRSRARDRERGRSEERKSWRRENYRKKVEAAGGPKIRPKQDQDLVKAKKAENFRRYYEKNKEALYAKKKSYVARNREKHLKTQKLWRESNKGKRTALEAKRRAARKLSARVVTSEIDDFVWSEAASLSILRRETTGIDWNVDHMIPLLAKGVCGLHVWNNCQVIPASLNVAKRNKLVLTSPGEWIARL